MSAIQNNNSASPAAAAEKVKKITLSAQSTKYMVFGNWFVDRLVAGGQMTNESVTESRRILGMWSSVEDQIALYDGFVAELKSSTKDMKAIIRQFHKPPKATKKAKTAASEGEKKRGRKKKEVVEEQDPVLALNERLIAAAQSDEPIVVAPEYVRAPKQPDTDSQEPKTPEPITKEQAAMPAKPERPTKPVKEPKQKVKVDVVDKEAAKAAEKAEKELAKAEAKAAEKAEKEAAKAAEKAEKEAAKAAEKAEKEAAKAAEKAEKEAAKAAEKAAAKVAKEPKKKAEKELPIPVLARNSPAKLADDEEEEEELECEVFKLDGVEYLIDSLNTVYDRNTQDIIGTYDSINKKINKA